MKIHFQNDGKHLKVSLFAQGPKASVLFLWAAIFSEVFLTSCDLQPTAKSRQANARSDQQQETTGVSATKAENWERMRQCATRADQLTAAAGLVEGQRNGDVVTLGWINHYSPKFEHCYVLVSYLNKGGKAAPPGIPISYHELWDAFERRLLSTCAGPDFGSSAYCSLDGQKGFDCAACQQFIDDRMKR